LPRNAGFFTVAVSPVVAVEVVSQIQAPILQVACFGRAIEGILAESMVRLVDTAFFSTGVDRAFHVVVAERVCRDPVTACFRIAEVFGAIQAIGATQLLAGYAARIDAANLDATADIAVIAVSVYRVVVDNVCLLVTGVQRAVEVVG